MSDAIRDGDRVLCLDALGEWVPRIALSGVVQGRDFPVILVRREGKDERIPWPADSVKPAT